MQMRMQRGAQFFVCDAGAIAPIAAAIMLLVITVTGGAIDFSRAYSTGIKLQNSLDAAVLAGASASAENRVELAQRFFQKEFSAVDVAGSPVFANESNGSVTGSAALELNSTFLNVIGMKTLPVRASATASSGSTLEIEVELTALQAQGAFAKDIFVFTRDSNKQIIDLKKVLAYDFDGTNRSTSPPLNQVGERYRLSGGSTFGVMMRVYEDPSYLGSRSVQYVDHYSDDPAPRIKISGTCPQGAQHNWEDGGDSNYKDFVYLLRCFEITRAQPVRLVK